AICHIWRAPAQNRLQQAVALHAATRTAGNAPSAPSAQRASKGRNR
ncbi:MAG: crossover junction endodeoxyribonuclease RuvC, partial [Actinomycetes bacterium]